MINSSHTLLETATTCRNLTAGTSTVTVIIILPQWYRTGIQETVLIDREVIIT